MKLNAMLGVALTGWMVACGGANAETLKLSAAADARAAAEAALAHAAQSSYANAKVYDKQVFQLSLGTEALGTLVGGSGDFEERPQANLSCFVALVKPNNEVVLTDTVGFGDWEVETCRSIEAVGAVSPQLQTGFGRLVVIHSSTVGTDSRRSLVVLAWNPKAGSLEIDTEASRRLRRVPEGTVAAVRKILQ